LDEGRRRQQLIEPSVSWLQLRYEPFHKFVGLHLTVVFKPVDVVALRISVTAVSRVSNSMPVQTLLIWENSLRSIGLYFEQ
jgi:hypothetical protein